jgi:hypothetical protein
MGTAGSYEDAESGVSSFSLLELAGQSAPWFLRWDAINDVLAVAQGNVTSETQ